MLPPGPLTGSADGPAPPGTGGAWPLRPPGAVGGLLRRARQYVWPTGLKHNLLQEAWTLVAHDSRCRCRLCTLSRAGADSRFAAALVTTPSAAEAKRGVSPRDLACRRASVRADANQRALIHYSSVGNQFPREAFRSSPQEAAILNLHLREYFAAHDRARREAPYAVLPSQYALLEAAGLEVPVEGAPSVPHGFHKNLEEAQLRAMHGILVPERYGLISVKAAKQSLLPTPASIQNPVMEGRDVARYPESGLAVSTFAKPGHAVFLLHDVSSVVGPHELVERLVRENPGAHLFVTGVNPAEALERVQSFHPNSHRISYRPAEDSMHWMPAGSESEGYSQPISVTRSWLLSSSIRASNGRVYQVVLRDYKFGHCIWHVFAGDLATEETRAFPTGTLIRVPALYTGTFRDEWLNRDFVSKMLSFGERTTVNVDSNYLAKANGLRASNGAFISARDCHIGRNLCHAFDPRRSTWSVIWRCVYVGLCVLTLRWDAAFRTSPDVYELIDERSPALLVHPTEGGGWSRATGTHRWASIPDRPTVLEQASAFTAMAASLLVPKILIGAALTQFWHTDFFGAVRWLWDALEVSPARAALTAAALSLAAALPTASADYLRRFVAHFRRQLWLPARLTAVFSQAIVELTGAPGYRILRSVPGRGWLWQAGLWATFAHEIFPAVGSGSFTLFGAHSVFHHAPAFALAAHPFAAMFWYCAVASPVVLWALGRWARARVAAPSAPVAVPYDAPSAQLPIARRLLGHGRAALAWVTRTSWRRVVVTVAVVFWLASNDVAQLPVRRRLPTAVALVTGPAMPAVVALPPAPVVQPRLAPLAQRIAGYVSPDGLEYRDWSAAVRAAYVRTAAHYPALTPGASCFYDTLETLTALPAHMWYAWFLAAEGILPAAATQPYGEATPAEMIRFCALSGFGYSVDGVVQLEAPARTGWPVLFMTLTRNPDATLHCAPRVAAPLSPTVAWLAQLLATMRTCCDDWVLEEGRRSAVAGAAQRLPSPFAVAVFQGQQLAPFSHDDWLAALRASGHTAAITTKQRTTAWDFVSFPRGVRPAGPPNTWPSSFVIAAPTMDAPVRGGSATASTGCMGAFQPRVRTKRPLRGVPPPAPDCAPSRPAPRPSEVTPPPAAPSCDPAAGVARPLPVAAASRPATTYRDAVGVTARPSLSAVAAVAPVRGPAPVAPLTSRVAEMRAALEASLPRAVRELPPLPLREDVVTYVPDVDRARRLADDLNERPDLLGPLGSLACAKMLACIADYHHRRATQRPVKMTLLLGVAGCGKSTATRKILARMGADERAQTRIVTHTAVLRAEAKASIGSQFRELRGFNFPTLANILAQPTTGTVVFDDAGKFWGGLLDLVLLANPGVQHVVVNGDPAQGRAQIPVVGAMSEKLPTMVEAVAPLASHYATVSHRLPRVVADALGVHTTSTEVGFIRHVTTPTGCPTITSSPRYVQVLKGGCRDAVTFMDVQGEEMAGPVEVDITGLESAVTDAVAYVGLTRSRTGVYVHGEPGGRGSVLQPPTGSALLNAVLYDMRLSQASDYDPTEGLVRQCFYDHLRRAMPGLALLTRVGYDAHYSDFELHVTAAHLDPVADARAQDVVAVEPAPAAAPPADVFDPELAPRDSEARERTARGMRTAQFQETAVVAPPKHVRQDNATYQLSLDKRIRRATPSENRARAAAQPRLDMCAMFDVLVPNPPSWEKHGDLHFDTAPIEYAAGRTREAVESKLARHDPDRTGSDVTLSLKAQTIKKLEKLGSDAVGGQLIHEYDIGQTLRDSPYFRFLEERLLPRFPPNVHFYHRESVPEHIAAIRPALTLGRGYSGSDVTGWDFGCGADVLNFDCHVMRACGMPDDFVTEYRERRLTTRSQHGPMRTMQNSGDRGTWCMNSIRRAVVACITMRLEPQFAAFARTPPGVAYVEAHCPEYAPGPPGYVETLDVNGDDILMDVAKSATPFDDSPWVFKDQTGRSMEFSGMDFRPDGRVTYSPFGLYYRCLIKCEAGTTDPIQWRAYADLFAMVDSESPYALEIARLLLRHLGPDEVLTRTHASLADAVARIAHDPQYRHWVHSAVVRQPPPRALPRA